MSVSVKCIHALSDIDEIIGRMGDLPDLLWSIGGDVLDRDRMDVMVALTKLRQRIELIDERERKE